MKNSLIAIAVLLGIVGVVIIAQNSPTDIEVETETTILEQTNGTRLSIPSIGLYEKLIPAEINGRKFEVPDYQASYYENGNNLFIYGHNTTVFSRLTDKPQSLVFTKDGVDTDYTLNGSEIVPKSEISMDTVLAYNGAVLMTCSGENDENRLILYYKKS